MSSRFYNRLKKNRGHLLRLVLLLSGIDGILIKSGSSLIKQEIQESEDDKYWQDLNSAVHVQ